MFVKENCVCIGRIVRTHGIHGQLVVVSDFDLSSDNVKEVVLVNIDGGLVPFFVAEGGWKIRDHQSYFLHLDHLNCKEKAENYCGLEVYLINYSPPEIDATEDEYGYLQDYEVYDELDNLLGKVEELLDYSGNILLKVISSEKKELLLPFVEEQLLSINQETKQIHLQIPQGLLELE